MTEYIIYLDYVLHPHSDISLILYLIKLKEKSWSISWLSPKKEQNGQQTFRVLNLDQRQSQFVKIYVATSLCTGQKEEERETLS